MNQVFVDAIVIGGGIAGLWTHASLIEGGYKSILLEQNALGSGQTLASQGIIHGGSKYALSGKISNATKAISSMPETWDASLKGLKSPILKDCNILSNNQFLIPASGIDTKLLSFLGSRSMSSHTKRTLNKDLPQSYRDAGIDENGFQLNEMVLDTKSLMHNFLTNYPGTIFQQKICHQQIMDNDDAIYKKSIQLNDITLFAQRIIFTCGNGMPVFKEASHPMQQRPLQMVIAESNELPDIFVHFIGRSTKPVMTITSHKHNDNTVWYIGGDIAELGINKESGELIHECSKLLEKLTPNINLEKLAFKTFSINRAEPAQKGLKRPDEAFVERSGNIIYGWPTKLALAPQFAEKVLSLISCTPQESRKENGVIQLPDACVAEMPWEVS